MGILIPNKTRYCNKCKQDIICDKCNTRINQKNVFKANLNELNRLPPIVHGHMLPYWKGIN